MDPVQSMKRNSSMIEPHTKDTVIMGSERNFGFVFTIAFATIGLWPLMGGGSPRLWAIIAALVILALAHFRPATLRPLNIVWFRLGLLLGAVVTPAVMAMLYTTMFVPTGFALRLRGRDLLRLKREPEKPSYWLVRETPGPERGTVTRQF